MSQLYASSFVCFLFSFRTILSIEPRAKLSVCHYWWLFSVISRLPNYYLDKKLEYRHSVSNLHLNTRSRFFQEDSSRKEQQVQRSGSSQNEASWFSHHQGKPVSVRVSLVATLRPPQHPPLPAALLPHHPRHHCQHHGQVQCHKACGESEGERFWAVFLFSPFCYRKSTKLVSAAEPGYHPVPPNPPALGVFSAPALHRLLLRLLWVPLDQVNNSCLS